MKIAVVGATGLVGKKMLKVLEERIIHTIENDFKMNAKAFDNIDGDISNKIEIKGNYDNVDKASCKYIARKTK